MKVKNGKGIADNYIKVLKLICKVDIKSIVIIMIFTVIAGIIPTCSTLIMRNIVNLLQNSESQGKDLVIFVFFFILCDIFISLIGNGNNYLSTIVEQKLTLEIEMRILRKSQTLGLQDFEDSESYNMLQRAQTQSGTQVFSFFLHITEVIKYMVMVVGSVIILLSWNVWSIILVSSTALVSAILLLKVNKYQYEVLRQRTGKARERWYYQYILTNDITFKEIKLYGLHNYFENKFKNISERFIVQDKKIARKNLYIGMIRVILEQIGDGFILGKIFWDTFYGKILLGDTIAYIRSISNIKSNMNGLFMQTVSINKESLYINQLFEFLDKPAKGENIGKIKIKTIKSIEIKKLNYKYKNMNDYALKNINLNITNKDNYIIVGRNGSGKSTLVKILAGFYDDYEGTILINGINLKEIEKGCYREKIAILFQDYNKYELSVRENVCVGNLNEKDNGSKIVEALEYSNASPDLCENLDEQLGYWFNNGRQLSGGEWLRIGISRVFLRKAELYMLDEPNAALDSISEEQILSSLNKLIMHKMSIIITHRIGSIQRLFGKIIVFDHGKIIDQGDHNELLSRCKIYEELYKKSV